MKSSHALPISMLLAGSLIAGSIGVPQGVAQPIASTKAPANSDAHFEAAQTFQLAGDFGKAEEEYRQGICVALQRLGNLKVSNGDYAAGIELLHTAAFIDPKNLEAVIDLGIAQFRDGEYDQAKATALEVLKDDTTSFRSRNLLGKVYFVQGNFQAAADELQSALAVNPDFDVAYSLALADLELKKLPQATVLFDEMRASLRKSPNLHLLLGQAYRETGYLELAASEFKAALELDPHYPHAHAYLGMTYVGLGGEANVSLAREQFRAELTGSPRDYSSLYFLGQIELEHHDAAAAEALLSEAHRVMPEDAAALLLLGHAQVEMKKWNQAILSLGRSIALASTATLPASQVALTHELLSKAFAGAGKPVDAAREEAEAQRAQTAESQSQVSAPPNQRELQNLLAQNAEKPRPRDPAEEHYVASVAKALGNAYNNVGVIHARAGEYTEASEAFKAAARWDSAIPEVDHNWALAAFRAQMYSDAIAPLEHLLHRSPSDQKLRQMLALSYYMTKNFESSAATFRPIVNSLPDNAGLLVPAGIAFVKTGDSATGERLFARVFASGNSTPEVHLMLGQAYAEQSEGAQALMEFKRALELNPKLPEAHFLSGMVMFKRGELEQAATEFETELQLNPQHVPAMYQRAYILLQQHQTPEAIQLLSEVIKQQPSDPDAHYQLGKAMLEQGNVNSAVAELETSVKIRPSDYAYFQLSRAYTRAGRANDAERALQKYESLKPKPAHAVSSQ